MNIPYYLELNSTVIDFYPNENNVEIYSKNSSINYEPAGPKKSIRDVIKSFIDQTPLQLAPRDFLRNQFQGEIDATKVSNSKIFQKLIRYGHRAIENIQRIPLTKASICIISEDTIIIKFAYNKKFEISTIQSFDEDEDENAPLVAFLEDDKIVFQQEIPLDTLVERILRTLK